MRTVQAARRAALIAAIAIAPAGCYSGEEAFGVSGGDGTGQLTISAVSGGGQTGSAGNALGDSLVVRVIGPTGPAANVAVSWRVVVGGGTVSPTGVLTDAQGIAKARWILGPSVGQQLARASADNASGSPVDFSATAR